MFKNYFKTAFRQLWKNKLFTSVNVIGLSVGLASVIALLAGVYLYYTTDYLQKDKDRMYYLKTFSKGDDKGSMLTTYPLLGEIVRTCPEVESATHIQQWYSPWLKYGENEIQEKNMFADTGFFNVFSFPLKYGNAAIALKEKYSIVLSDKIAAALFGSTNPLGKIIIADDTAQLTVTGVLEPVPTNSTIRPDVLLTTAFLQSNKEFSGAANWYNAFARNYIKLKPGSSVPLFNTKMDKLVTLNYDKENKGAMVRAVSFSKMKDEGGAMVKVIINGSIATAVFILIIILVNLINLNAASVYTRTKEVAVRKIVGSGKRNIIAQFCTENGMLVLLSLILSALLFLYILLPQLNKIYGSRFPEISLNLQRDYAFALSILITGIIVAIIAGTLPVLKLISLPVTDAVKGKISKTGNSKYLRNIFITIQLSLAIIFICITFILNRQIDFMKTASLGFDKDHTVVINLDLGFKNPQADSSYFATVLNKLKSNPDISSLSACYTMPTAYDENYNTYYDPVTNKKTGMRHAWADAGFVPTYNIKMIEGRNFNDDLSASEGNSIIINRTAMRDLGWQNIEGKQLKQNGDDGIYKVVGVMEDFQYQDMQKGVGPLLHHYSGKANLFAPYLTLNIKGNRSKEILQELEKDFKAMPSRRAFNYTYMSELVSKQYALVDGILKITNFVALLTIIISCMGLFGLISLFARQRVKEIGVRKVLGAKTGGIVMLLSKDFVAIAIISCIIAFPVAWWAMNKWLESFANRISIQWWMFALSGLIAIIIVAFTISFQAIKAAVANPVKSLRTE